MLVVSLSLGGVSSSNIGVEDDDYNGTEGHHRCIVRYRCQKVAAASTTTVLLAIVLLCYHYSLL